MKIYVIIDFSQLRVQRILLYNNQLETIPYGKPISYLDLSKQLGDVKAMLTKKTPDDDCTYCDAIRVYLWDKAGFEIPELSARDLKALTDVVRNDGELMKFAEQLF